MLDPVSLRAILDPKSFFWEAIAGLIPGTKGHSTYIVFVAVAPYFDIKRSEEQVFG
jgi:hypothetical protein